MTEPKKKFIFIIESTAETRRLDVDETDILINADGEMDIPLDRVLSRYQLNFKDLFSMNVNLVSLMEEFEQELKIIRSISFDHLYHT